MEANKFPKHGFLDVQFNKWLHKATSWYQLEVEALKLYTTTIFDLKLTIREVHGLMTLEEYICH